MGKSGNPDSYPSQITSKNDKYAERRPQRSTAMQNTRNNIPICLTVMHESEQ